MQSADSGAVGLVEHHVAHRPGGDVAYVTIQNPRRLNVLNTAVMIQLVEAFSRVVTNHALRAVVLTGAGPKAFVGGADIHEMVAIQSSSQARAFITRVHHCCDAIRNCPVPVIARIQGYTFGAGLELAAACDIRIAADSATFGMPEVKLGIPSVVEAALLPMLVGWGRAREILLLGESFSARDALEWRLVERVVSAASLDDAVETCVEQLMSSKPRAVHLQKQLVRQWEDMSPSAAIQRGIDAFAAAFESDEPTVAMQEFLRAQAARKQQR
ncbi:MAG: enoyl-CoA hydratase [Chloroflexota bacterium]